MKVEARKEGKGRGNKGGEKKCKKANEEGL